MHAHRLKALQLYFHTLVRLTPAQIADRAARVARRKLTLWGPSGEPALALVSGSAGPQPGWGLAREAGPWSQEYEAAAQMGARIVEGRFTFVGRTVVVDHHALPWNDSGLSQLWRFHLHYFDYVAELAAYAGQGPDQRSLAATTLRNLASEWIAANPYAGGDGWHPYTVSRRLVNWIAAAHMFAPELSSNDFNRSFLASISQQARYLAGNLERDVRGNHLLANLRALVCCGVFLDGAEAAHWEQASLNHLRLEVAEQVLPDGGHFERNPGYHLVVLRDLIDVACWLEQRDHGQPTWLGHALERMLDYLVAILPPSHEVPMIKDTAWDQAPDPNAMLAAGCIVLGNGRWKRTEDFPLYAAVTCGEVGWDRFRKQTVVSTSIRSTALPDTGHYVLRDDLRGDFLIFDAGEPCPPYLPAHAHADLLSYELTVSGTRVIVDSGVYEYAPGAWRDYFRSTRAHNTVEVSGQNQSEVWGSFRTARRAKPSRVSWQPEAERVLVAAEHNGYVRLRPPITHRRWISWQVGAFWLVVDRLEGSGQVRFKSFVHVHNSLSIRPTDQLTWRIDGLPRAVWITTFGNVSTELVRGQIEPDKLGWQSENFGELIANPVLVMNGSTSLPALTGYVVSLDQPVALEQEGSRNKPEVAVMHLGRRYSCTLAG